MEQQEASKEGIDSKVFFQVVKDNKKVVAVIILCCTLIAAIYAFSKPVEYRSEAVICLRNPAITGIEENLQTIMLLKQNSELNDIDLNYVKESSSIRVETNKESPQAAYEALKKALECVRQDINKQNNEKELENYPSLDFAKEEMINAQVEYEMQLLKLPEDSIELKKTQEEYVSKAQVYNNLLNSRIRTLYAVQVIQNPSIPDKPEKTKRGNHILIGFLMGCLISFYYCMRQYKKKG